MNRFLALCGTLVAAVPGPAEAEIVSAGPGHFELRHEAISPLPPDALWERLVDPSRWWHPDHTYSGDAGNLSLDLRAGGLWAERWADGETAHGEVLLFRKGELLRLSAPFGPLQGMGAYAVWTIRISAEGDGSLVVFEEVATGPPSADLEQIAGAVDYVKSEAIARLASPE